ncbi:MAG: hypothetical protein FWD43_02365 [Coriobacteriia bacterium]|nr:hypothetical protein [Coriobacteriia bacterium]
MRRKLEATVLSLSLSVLFFFGLFLVTDSASSIIISGILGRYAHLLYENPFVYYGFLGIISIVFFVTVYQLLRNRVSRFLISAEAIVYLLAVLAIVFLKSLWLPGLNPEGVGFVGSITWSPNLHLFHIFLFLPIGAMTFRYIKSPLKAFLMVLATIVVIKILQYVFNFWVLDIMDLVAIILGFAAGFVTLSMLYARGFRISTLDKWRFKIVSPQKQVVEDDDSEPEKTLSHNPLKWFKKKSAADKRIIIIAIAMVLAIAVLFIIDFALFNPEDYLRY